MELSDRRNSLTEMQERKGEIEVELAQKRMTQEQWVERIREKYDVNLLEVEGEVTGQHMARPKILAPVEARVSPPCRHAKSCGGCQLQHAAPDFTAAWRVDVIARALQAHGLEPAIRPIVTSPPQSRRRARFSARRTKKGALAGFHQKGSDVIVAVPDCILVTPALAAALPMVEELAVLGASRKGELSVLVTETLAGLDVHATGGKPLDGELRVGLAALGEKHDLARISWEDEALTRRPPHLAFGTATVVPPPGAFLQPTQEGADTLMMSTDPRATRDNFARDMQWGQGIQLLEDLDAEALDAVRNPGGISTRPPTPLVVKAGEQLRAAVRLSSDSVVLQFGVRRAGAA